MTTLQQKQIRADLSRYEFKKENLLIGLTAQQEKIKLNIELKIKDRPQKSWDDLKDVDFPLCLSISGNIGSHSGGQNYEEIQNLIADDKIIYKNNWNKEKLFEIIEIWKKYHLNDLQSATYRQIQLFEMHQNSNEFLRFLEYEKIINKKDFNSYEIKKLLLDIFDKENIQKGKELRDKKQLIIELLQDFKKRIFLNDERLEDRHYSIEHILNYEVLFSGSKFKSTKTPKFYIYASEIKALNTELEKITEELQKPEYYIYSSDWLYKLIPFETIKEIHNIINSLTNADISLNNMIVNEEFTNKLNYEIKPQGQTESPWDKKQFVRKYEVTLTFETRKMIFPFYCGLNCSELTIFSILECLQLDCQLFNNYNDVDDFASEMGIEKPSEAIKQFNAVEKQYTELKELFNDDFDLFLNSDIS